VGPAETSGSARSPPSRSSKAPVAPYSPVVSPSSSSTSQRRDTSWDSPALSVRGVVDGSAARASSTLVPNGTSTLSTPATSTIVTASTTGSKVISGAGTSRTKNGSSPDVLCPTANFAGGAIVPAAASSAVTVYTAVVQVRGSADGVRSPYRQF